MIGILHPGQMGSAVAATLRNGGHRVLWASEGRSQASKDRAAKQGLEDAGTLAELCEQCSAIFSVCPPHAAEAQADCVARLGYRGMYVDANAVSPETVRRIGQKMSAAGMNFVDGGIIGLPTTPNWMCLSGPSAPKAAALMSAGPMTAEITGPDIGQASALKMCFAAYSKGIRALALSVIAAAQRQGVWEDLQRHWTRDGRLERIQQESLQVAGKAWRFVGEMHEIAATFESVGVPGGFHESAAEIYERLHDLKDGKNLRFEQILDRLA